MTLDEVHAAFVGHTRFVGSVNRPVVWEGFCAYVAAWESAEQEVGGPVVLAWWLAGSFISDAMEPDDIDVTPVLDGDWLDGSTGVQGMGKVKRLIGHRESVRQMFRVEPFPLRWSAEPCTLFPDRLPPAVQARLAKRGGLDAWWQRLRPAGPKGPPAAPTEFAERGYLEVLR